MAVTFVMLKPDAVQRQLVYKVFEYFLKAGLKIECFDVKTATAETICRHYAEHIGKYGPNFKKQTLDMFEGKTVVPAILSGPEDVVEKVREIVGATQPAKAEKGTVRGDLGLGDSYEFSVPEGRLVRNLIHASDTPEAVKSEAALWLPEYDAENCGKEQRH